MERTLDDRFVGCLRTQRERLLVVYHGDDRIDLSRKGESHYAIDDSLPLRVPELISPAQARDGVPVFKITPIEALLAQASTQASERRTVVPVVRFDPISLANHDELAVSCEPGA